MVALVVVVALRGAGGDDPSRHPFVSPAARAAPDCGAGDLVADDEESDAAGGTTYLTATLRLAPGVEPCTVRRFPGVVVLDRGAPADVTTVPDERLGEPQDLVVLPDQPVLVTLGWSVGRYCERVDNDGIVLRVAPDLELEVPGFGPTSCPAGGAATPPLRVGPYTYVDPRSTNGTVVGVVVLVGGPGPGTGEFVTRGRLELDGTDDYGAAVGPDGDFELEVPAGVYQVRVSTPQWHAGRPYDGGTLSVAAGELNQLNVILPAH